MELLTLKIGYMDNNCYVLFKDGSNEAIIIDPSDDGKKIESDLKKMGLIPSFVLITHAHYDHIGAVSYLQILGAKVYMHKADKPIIEWSVTRKGTATFEVDYFLNDGEFLDILGLKIKVIHTPGHSPGGVCYLVGNFLFTGDTLFYESVGRGDLPLGNPNQLSESIKEKLFILDDETKVYPGHGRKSSIGHEKKFNPYVK